MAEKNYDRTTEGLRDLLFDTILGVRSGSISAQQANVVASLSRELLSTLDMELKAQRQAKDLGHDTDAITLAPPTIRLVTGPRS